MTASESGMERLDPNMAVRDAGGDTLWYDARDLCVEGLAWTDTEEPYDRLPARAKGRVRPEVWTLSKHSAGACLRFVTDAPRISVRWALKSSSLSLPHMPSTGASGVDLYGRVGGAWRWLAVGMPDGEHNAREVVRDLAVGDLEVLLYLPLYNGVSSVEVGIPGGSRIGPAPQRPHGARRPLVVYGTSIVQGGCASRPGMAYPAILGRRYDVPVINLGFSGNGRMEPEMAELLAEIDAAAYVLDCLPNLEGPQVAERTEPFVGILRAARPRVPVVLVENIVYTNEPFIESRRRRHESSNAALRAAYGRLLAAGNEEVHLAPGAPLLGLDGEATVDGTHPTDLGFLRMADALTPYLRQAFAGD
jgi:lysophospholipase L1-like esterase